LVLDMAGMARTVWRWGRRPAGEGRYGRAIARRLFGEIVRRANAAGAGHHLHGHRRIAGDVAADVAADQSRVEIDTASRRAGHIDCHRAVDDVLRLPRLRAGKDEHGAEQDRPEQCHDTAMRMCSLHAGRSRQRECRPLLLPQIPRGLVTPVSGPRRHPSALYSPSAPPAAWQWSCTTALRWDTCSG